MDEEFTLDELEMLYKALCVEGTSDEYSIMVRLALQKIQNKVLYKIYCLKFGDKIN